MMRSIPAVLAASFLVLSTLTVTAACDDNDGKQACEAFASKCPAGSPGAGTTTCDAERINNATNGGQVEDCVQGAADCNAAVACLGTLK